MGIEWIRSQSGKPYTKRWARGLDRLKTPTLFDVSLGAECRVLTAMLVPGYDPKVGDACLIQADDAGTLLVLDGHRQIASVTSPPPQVIELLKGQNGMALATIQRIGSFGTTAELKL
jgi:hypothetical protein